MLLFMKRIGSAGGEQLFACAFCDSCELAHAQETRFAYLSSERPAHASALFPMWAASRHLLVGQPGHPHTSGRVFHTLNDSISDCGLYVYPMC